LKTYIHAFKSTDLTGEYIAGTPQLCFRLQSYDVFFFLKRWQELCPSLSEQKAKYKLQVQKPSQTGPAYNKTTRHHSCKWWRLWVGKRLNGTPGSPPPPTKATHTTKEKEN
jgi:hypothetical protein